MVKLAPSDPDAAAKFRECEKIVKREAFAAAIASPEEKKPHQRVTDDDLDMGDQDWKGPTLPAQLHKAPTADLVAGLLTPAAVGAILDCFKAEKQIHRRQVLRSSSFYSLLTSLRCTASCWPRAGSWKSKDLFCKFRWRRMRRYSCAAMCMVSSMISWRCDLPPAHI